MIGLFISFSVGLNISIADFLGLFGLGELGIRGRRPLHPATVDHRQQHAVPADAARAAHPPGRPDGRPAVSTTRNVILLLVGLAILAILPVFLSPNLMNAVIKMMIAALFALAFTLAMGQAGMLSFGHAAYYGLGAFAALHLMRAVEMKLFFFPTPLDPARRSGDRLPVRHRVRLARDATHRRLFRHGDAGAGRAALHAGADMELRVRRRVRHLHHARCVVGAQLRRRTATSTT